MERKNEFNKAENLLFTSILEERIQLQSVLNWLLNNQAQNNKIFDGCSRSSFVQLVLHFVSQQIRKCHQHHNVIQNESSKDNSFSNSQLYLTTKDPSEHERNTTLNETNKTLTTCTSTPPPSSHHQNSTTYDKEFPPLGTSPKSGIKSKPSRQHLQEISSQGNSRRSYSRTPKKPLTFVPKYQQQKTSQTSTNSTTKYTKSETFQSSSTSSKNDFSHIEDKSTNDTEVQWKRTAEKFLSRASQTKALEILATLYGSILLNKLQPRSFTHDLFLIFQMLAVNPIVEFNPSAQSKTSDQHVHDDLNSKLLESLFCSGANFIFFAACCIKQLLPLLSAFSMTTRKHLRNNIFIQILQPSVIEKLSDSISLEQKTQYFPRNKPYPDFSMPFKIESDTNRNNFKTQFEMTIFNNREYIRDSFLDIVYETHLSKERKLLETVLPQNYPFFCSLFIKELLKNALGITDLDPQLQNKIDPKRLNLLNRRLTQSNSIHQNNTNSKEETISVEHPFRFAFKNDKENIFAQFLFDENNYLLNYFLIAQIKAKITELNDLTSIEDIEADFAERVAQLKILAKFLGFLVFLPITLSVFSTSVGFTSLISETVRFLNNQEPPLDLLNILKKACENAHLCLTLPWVCEFLKLLKNDKIIRETEYMKKVFVFLKGLYRSEQLKLNTQCSMNTLFIVIELSQLFSELDFDLQFFEENSKFEIEEEFQRLSIDQQPKQFTTSSVLHISSSSSVIHSPVDTQSELLNFGRFIELCYPFMDDLAHFLSECNTQQKRLLSVESSLSKNSTPLLCVLNEECSSFVVQSQKKASKKIAPIHIQSAPDITSHQQTNDQQTLKRWFFWQHPDLNRLSDYIAKRVINNWIQCADHSIALAVEEFVSTQGSKIAKDDVMVDLPAELIEKIIQSLAAQTNTIVSQQIHDGITLLAEPKNDARVVSVAIDLTTTETLSTIQKMLTDDIPKKVMTLVQSRLQKIQKTSRTFKHATPITPPPPPPLTPPPPTPTPPTTTMATVVSSDSACDHSNPSTPVQERPHRSKISESTHSEIELNIFFDRSFIESQLRLDSKRKRRRAQHKVSTEIETLGYNLLRANQMLLEILPLIEHSQLDTLSDSPLASKNEKQCECDSELWSRLFSILTFIGENILQLGREPLKRTPLHQTVSTLEHLLKLFDLLLVVAFFLISQSSVDITVEEFESEWSILINSPPSTLKSVILLICKLFIEAGIRDTRLAFQIPIFFFDCSFSHSRFRRLLESKASQQNRIWWSVLSSFLFCLLKKGLLFGLTLEEQLLSIYQFLPSNQNSIEMFFNELVADLIIRYHKTMKTAPNYNTLHFIKLLNFLLQATSISAQLREQIMTALNEQLQFVNKNTNQK